MTLSPFANILKTLNRREENLEMKFHFKQALEKVKQEQTLSGKAEEILRSTIDVLKQMPIDTITEICFSIGLEGNEKTTCPYRIYASTYFEKQALLKKLHHSPYIPSYEQAVSIFEMLETELSREGYECKDNTSTFRMNGRPAVKSFYIKL